jgi:hypothetical protein
VRTVPPLSFLIPPPMPPPVAEAGVAVRKPQPITCSRSATATSAAPIRRNAMLAPQPFTSALAPNTLMLTRKPPIMSSRTLAVLAGPSPASSPPLPPVHSLCNRSQAHYHCHQTRPFRLADRAFLAQCCGQRLKLFMEKVD